MLDLPQAVAYADLAMLEELGDPDELLARAVANTRAEQAPLTQGGLPVERDGTTTAHNIFILAGAHNHRARSRGPRGARSW